jgi:hypothetical protein
MADKLSTLYQENARVASIFWDWRHKLLTFFFTAVGGLSIATAWAYTHVEQSWRFLAAALPLSGVVVIGTGCIALERRNKDILDRVYKVGAEIEKQWADPTNLLGIFTSFTKAPRLYTKILKRIFASISFMASVAIIALISAFLHARI